MSQATEQQGWGHGAMATTLATGLDTLDLNQVVTFTLYCRKVLPADGFVFWVKADLLSPSSAPNAWTLNSVTPNELPLLETPALSFDAQGSLHHTTVNTQGEDESFSNHRMIFTSKGPVNELGLMGPNYLYLATVDGQRFCFSTRSGWYRQAGLYNYSGDAVYPTLATQIVDSPLQLDLLRPVVSNSLPLWLMMGFGFDIYPSFLMPDNLKPPYITVNIQHDWTEPLGAAVFTDATGSRYQHMKDTVQVSMHGLRADDALDWVYGVQQFALSHPETFGIMNSPVLGDAKRSQVEINTIAQKKNITFEVNYYQTRLLALSQQFIRQAFIENVIVTQAVI